MRHELYVRQLENPPAAWTFGSKRSKKPSRRCLNPYRTAKKDEKREGIFRSFGVKTSENEGKIMEKP